MHPNPNDPSTYNKTASWYLSLKEVTLPHLDSLTFPSYNSDGSVTIYAAVYGISNCNFTLVAYTSESNIMLQSGVAVYRHVERSIISLNSCF